MEEAYSELYQEFLRLRSLCLRQAALLHQLTTALQKQQGPYESYWNSNAHKRASYDLLYTCKTLSAGATVPNGELSDMMSIPVQCTQLIPGHLQEKPEPQSATAHNPAAQCGLSRNVVTFSDLLAVDMSKLHVDGACQRNENRELAQNVGPLLSLGSLRWEGASSKVSKNLLQADHLSGDRTMLTVRVRRCLYWTIVSPVDRGSPVCPCILPRSSSKIPCLVLCVCPQMPGTDRPSLVDDFPSQSDGLLMSDMVLQSHVCEFCQAVFPGDTTTRGEFLRHLYTHIT